ncbi:pentatricopeptide repeat-containing protein DOT4, chloroplastic isoform X2 [Ziziphus jujuba]|uniref:Pentatricopeptide repeat-containing protein DOT4, chloroplastic isoform X2 n=1 Tax=Ziziphus jujuba TaxID=326968 RepID=A0A6P4AVK4_ZIZJJ|nr:pentatricopeptide repeat-containing protein DOT4, chloroplastic isoform X2 [Ziziphus jujuba]
MVVVRATSSPSTTNFGGYTCFQLNRLLQICCSSKTLNHGKQVHQQIIQGGLGRNPFLVTKLVQMYADCDHLLSARILFDQLSQPNVFAWTAIIGFYSRHGMYQKCVRTYAEMSLMGVSPDEYVFPKVLKVCAQSSCLKAGMQIHKDVITSGFEFSSEVCNSLIEMYSKCMDVQNAKRVFDVIVGRDLLSWNLMISGYVYNGLLESAVKLLDRMRFDGCEPDVVTWNIVMDAYCQMRLCDEAWNIFERIKEPNIISWTTLIKGYSRIGNHEVSLRIFRDMISSGMISPDLDCLSGVLVSCRHLGSLSGGREIHSYGIKMKSCIAFYNSAGATLLTMYAKYGRLQDAKNVFKLMDQADVVTWNAMILGFADVGLEHSALECFSKMQRAGIKNDRTTISTVLPVCDLKSGKQIHAFIRKGCFDLVTPVWNALIYMYSKCGCIRSASLVFSNMLTRDVVSWNSMMGGFRMHGLGQAALELLKEMRQSALEPDSMTFTSVLSACSHSGLVNEGLEVFHKMTKYYCLTPSMEHYACIVDMLARAGRLQDAVTFIQNMPLEPDKSIWGTLLAACRSHQNVDVAKLAAEQLVLLEPEHAGHYVTLSNIFARAGRWDDSLKVSRI